MNSPLPILLSLAAALQLAIAALNLSLVPLFHWRQDLARMPLLLREVFRVHAWFISVTLAIFAVMTWRFAGQMATHTDPAAQWLAAGIGMFWAIRTFLQVAYYSSSHWRGKPARTVAHFALLLGYGGVLFFFLFVCLLSAAVRLT